MSYRLTITDEQGRSISKEVSTEQALSALLDAGIFASPPKPSAPVGKKMGRPKSKPDFFDDEKQPRKKFDKDEIRRLIKDSDLTPAEIAQKIGCSAALVYIIKNKMGKEEDEI